MKKIPWFWLMFVVGSISLLLYLRGPRTAPKLAPPKATVAATYDGWPLPEAPVRPKTAVNRPSAPMLPPAIRDGRIPAFKGWEPNSLSLRIKALSESHPHPEINKEFNDLVVAGVISLNFQTTSEMAAMFQVIPEHMVNRSVSTAKPKPEHLLLSIDPDWLGTLQGEDEILTAMLLLYHEFQHYKQWRDGDERTRLMFRLRNDEGAQDKLGVTQADACADMWRQETPAYAAQCRLANAWGFPYGGDLCKHVDSPTWSHAIFSAMGSEEPYRTYCLRVFAELAGHPNPNQFPAR